MKYLLIALCLLSSSFVFSGNAEFKKDSTELEIFDRAEVMPVFPGGTAELFKFLAHNIQYPSKAREDGLQGRVIVKFYLDTLGNLNDPIVIADNVGGGCAEEAIRVIKNMPKWTPGVQRGRLVKVIYTLPVTFKLVGEKHKDSGKAVPLCTPDSLQRYLGNVAQKIENPIVGNNTIYVIKATCTILENGKIGNVVISESNYPDRSIEKIIEAHILSGPAWSPEIKKGKPVVSIQELQFYLTFNPPKKD